MDQTMLPSDIWHLCGVDQDGPNVLVLGGTHGDELTGVRIVRDLLCKNGLDGKPSGVYPAQHVRGNLFIGIGNPVAIKQNKRPAYHTDAAGNIIATDKEPTDLNRCFNRDVILAEPKPCEDENMRRARELAPLMERVDFLFDIHATSSESVPFICFGKDDEAHRDFYRYAPVNKILTDQENVLSTDKGSPVLVTTDSYVDNYGGSPWGEKNLRRDHGVAFCYETGHQEDFEAGERAYDAVLVMMMKTGVIGEAFIRILQRRVRECLSVHQDIYTLKRMVKAMATGFVYAPGMDQGWTEVEEDQLLGHYPDGTPEMIVQSGMLLFQKHPDKVESGVSLYYIAERID